MLLFVWFIFENHFFYNFNSKSDVENYMSEEINYVITDKAWNDDFKKSKQENKSLIIVGDDWINACVRRKKLISYEPFEVEND